MEPTGVLIQETPTNPPPLPMQGVPPACGTSAPPLTVLTTDAIIADCKNKGLYRNPVYNDKLYLHGKGLDRIATTAFEPYTAIRVLWLEGNALKELPCGAPRIQVRPPAGAGAGVAGGKTPRSETAEDAESADEGSSGGNETSHATLLLRASEKPPTEEEEEEEGGGKGKGNGGEGNRHVDPTTGIFADQAGEKTLPCAAEIPVDRRDGFSSLYPTVRQLYLHNNFFREMPDLSRFERLDAVNLANNFFSAVRPGCPFWEAQTRRRQAEGAHSDAALARSFSKSAQKEAQEAMEAQQGGETNEKDVEKTNPPPPGGLAKEQPTPSMREAVLDSYRLRVEVFSRYCPHKPLCGLEDHGKLPENPSRAERNPCSSLRSLNLAGNQLESFEDIVPLLCYKALSNLDLSDNRLNDGMAVLLVLERLPMLTSLRLSKNPLVATLANYRKTVLSRCKQLLYLDERPVFPEERRLVNAWATGGQDGEVKERLKIKMENEREHKQRLEDFRKIIRGSAMREGETHPHAAFIRAIQGLASREGSRERSVEVGRDVGADSSPTSSEEEEEEGFRENGQQNYEMEENRGDENQRLNRTPAAAATRPPQPRVLSCNANLNPGAASYEDENQDDIYVPQ
ncbi:unnamed protein product [Phytomonas sp. EM1]|nr:unnamed protein product [Phytomonas sp. EM1]|eukprot:CCW65147.1 unnamed protein product [Phytomonas sp. isolate EM1]